LYNEKFLLHKLNYIHKNPCHPKWDLAAHPCDYLYSSGKFYYNRENSFEILQHYADEAYVITAKGIWIVEKELKDFAEDNLLEFIQNKFFTFGSKHKPIDDKDKIAIFSLLCIRNFSFDVPMDLKTSKQRDEWKKIFEIVFDFLNGHNYFKEKYKEQFEKVITPSA